MYYLKHIKDGYIIGLQTSNLSSDNNIAKEEYDLILDKILNKPEAEPGYVYKLLADTLEWQLNEKPIIERTQEEIDNEEIGEEELISILMGDYDD